MNTTTLTRTTKLKFKSKIKELYKYSNKFVDYSARDYIQQHLSKKELMDEVIKELITMSTKHNTIIGRVVQIPYNDSYTYYVVTKVNKATARIDWLDYGDRLVHDYFQKAALADIDFITKQLNKENTFLN